MFIINNCINIIVLLQRKDGSRHEGEQLIDCLRPFLAHLWHCKDGGDKQYHSNYTWKRESACALTRLKTIYYEGMESLHQNKY